MQSVAPAPTHLLPRRGPAASLAESPQEAWLPCPQTRQPLVLGQGAVSRAVTTPLPEADFQVLSLWRASPPPDRQQLGRATVPLTGTWVKLILHTCLMCWGFSWQPLVQVRDMPLPSGRAQSRHPCPLMPGMPLTTVSSLGNGCDPGLGSASPRSALDFCAIVLGRHLPSRDFLFLKFMHGC